MNQLLQWMQQRAHPPNRMTIPRFAKNEIITRRKAKGREIQDPCFLRYANTAHWNQTNWSDFTNLNWGTQNIEIFFTCLPPHVYTKTKRNHAKWKKGHIGIIFSVGMNTLQMIRLFINACMADNPFDEIHFLQTFLKICSILWTWCSYPGASFCLKESGVLMVLHWYHAKFLAGELSWPPCLLGHRTIGTELHMN